MHTAYFPFTCRIFQFTVSKIIILTVRAYSVSVIKIISSYIVSNEMSLHARHVDSLRCEEIARLRPGPFQISSELSFMDYFGSGWQFTIRPLAVGEDFEKIYTAGHMTTFLDTQGKIY